MRSTETQPNLEAGVEVETTYLDLDGDGVPDAVQIVEAVGVDLTGDGRVDFIELVEEVASDIGVDGVPGSVDVVEHQEIELDHEQHPAQPSSRRAFAH
jgi:hypothetical protein